MASPLRDLRSVNNLKRYEECHTTAAMFIQNTYSILREQDECLLSDTRKIVENFFT